MIIRPREPSDLPALVAALREVHEADAYPVNWPDDPAAWLDPPKLLDARVAELDGEIVGQAGIGETEGLPAKVLAVVGDEPVAAVVRLFVAPSGRGHGAGRLLLDAAVAMAAGRGARAVLDVEAGGTAAIALYERAGWKRVHSGPGDWTTPSGETALLHHYVGPS
ncbi:GNAT family N-acetyltransferase [Phytomonospora endophytica]|uniref:GNAT superfamily N-acetyltransferase n=1 Tax=Phytomonospora endophytica TaxID=714109 RepID=A0A841FMG1_9ACTN|nr:GNAT family N-acetyltransferase [Phytomonospora endophytica]MBB6037044.1 GNAT superfamily N-acetyltransferase [Phytomonospora endophytica]GIG69412.1 GNAT family N-acetyltransferase [Phytomonospora endophytica]